MKPEVQTAIDEIKEAFPGVTVTAKSDEQGGAYVKIDPIKLSPQFMQEETWIKFHITFQYPYSDVYPHFVRPDLSRKDGKELGEAMSLGSFGGDGEPAVQISRKSNRLNPATDTAALKLLKVIKWLRSR
jgi:hypothetical protein